MGFSLWAARQISRVGSDSAFPKYRRANECNANSASDALNKWLKPRVPDACVVHSFRHSIRDRLKAVECPTDIIDAIGGWSKSTVGERYGTGYSIKIKSKWLENACAQ